jgi:tyramine---L-glutamate ligase
MEGGGLSLAALNVNAIVEGFSEFAALAQRIAVAIPGLWGYVGVDFVQTADGPLVLEVNPRLTTSFCGLRAALGVNVAALVLDLWQSAAPRHWQSRHRGTPVEITLERA